MNYLRQIIFEMRHHPLMTWLSIAGTAIAIFLIMSDFMINNIDTVSVDPETHRSRIVYGYGLEMEIPNSTSSGTMALETAKMIYDGLDGVEYISYSAEGTQQKNVSLKGEVPENKNVKSVDENFWNIYNFNFEEGNPFSKEEVEAGIHNVILTRHTAEHFFGKKDAYIGNEIMINNQLYTVTGIVTDVNPLLDLTHSDAYIPHLADQLSTQVWNTYFGVYTPILLLKEGVSIDHIKQQVKKRYAQLSEKFKSEQMTFVYHEQPWNLEQMHSGSGTNNTPDLSDQHRTRLIAYIVLLLIPAINLSTMSRSRMRQRISEIGLRRAFGCTRFRISADLLTENMIITLIGGLIGFILSLIFIISFSNYFINYGGWWVDFDTTYARPTFSMLFSWKAFAGVLVFCLVLNLLSAGIPALKAAFINPAEAISGQNPHK